MDANAMDLPLLPIVRPMEAYSADDLTEAQLTELLEGGGWVSEEKIRGCRCTAHVTADGLRLQSNKHGSPIERTENFPHLAAAKFNGVAEGTIFDCEIWLPTKEKPTHSVVLATPEKAAELQERYGPAELHIFDVVERATITFCRTLFSPVVDCSDSWEPNLHPLSPLDERRAYLEHVFFNNPHLADHSIVLVEQRRDHDAFFEEVIAAGGEGTMLKMLSAPYVEGARMSYWIKRKEVDTVDGWITGISKNGDGKIVSLRVSTHLPAGPRDIGAFKITAEMWLDLLDSLGELLPGVLGRAVEVKGNGWTSGGCLENLRFVQWRPDKSTFDPFAHGRGQSTEDGTVPATDGPHRKITNINDLPCEFFGPTQFVYYDITSSADDSNGEE